MADFKLSKLIKQLTFTFVPALLTVLVYYFIDMGTNPVPFFFVTKFILSIIIVTSLLVKDYTLVMFPLYLFVAGAGMLITEFTQVFMIMFVSHLALILAGWANFCAYVKRITKGGRISDWSLEGVGGLLNFWASVVITFTLFIYV